ncbi:MAG: TonB-dependent receptor [Rhodobiaceae bacterium]|nr:TonB-dependent receptor [Rhodobiaceae bacterium]
MKLNKVIYFLVIVFIVNSISLYSKNIEEIVVTGTKSKTQIIDQTGNLSFINSEEINFISPDNPSNVLNRMPGVFISQGSGQEHLTSIRSPVLSGGAGAGSFLYLEDGIPLRSPGFSNVNGLMESTIEIGERTEVIRGPGSVLYGSNAVHGLINVITEKDNLNYNNKINLRAGKNKINFNSSTYRNLDKSDILFNFLWKEDNGYTNSYTDQNLDKFDKPHYGQQKFLIRMNTQKNAKDYIFLLSGTNLNQETMGYIKGYQAYKNKEIKYKNPDPEAFRDTYNIRSYLKIIQDFQNGSLSITPYFRYTDMDFKMHFLPGKPLEQNNHKSLGLQTMYHGSFNNHFMTIGLDLEMTEGELSEFQSAPDVSFGPRLAYPRGAHYDYNIDSQILAAFVNIEWNLSEKTKLITGIRGEKVEYKYKTNIDPGTKGRIQVSSNRDDDFTEFSPKLAINHKINNQLAIFANYSRGNRAPQTTDLYRIQSKQIPGGAKSEKLDSIEIGLRGGFNIFNIELVGFDMKKENYFFRDSQGFNVENGKTTHRGLEVNILAEFNKFFQIENSTSFAEHKYDFDHLPNGIKSGNQIDSAPELLANTRFIYSPKEGTRIELEWEKIDRYPVDERNAHFYKGHSVINLRAKTPINENLSIGIYVNNINNKSYANRADFAFGSYRYFVGQKREFYLMLESKF